MAASACSSWPTAKATSGGYEVDSRRNPPVVTLTLDGAARLFLTRQEWRTPVSRDADRGPSQSHAKKAGKHSLLSEVAKWPTPDASAVNDGESPATSRARQARIKKRGINGNGAGVPLAIAAQEARDQWPTPAARDYKGANSAEHVTTNGTGRMHMDQLANFVEHGFLRPPQDPPTPAGPTSPPPILSFYRRFRATTGSALRSEMRALLRMAIRSRPGRRVEGLRRPLWPGWTRRRSDPFVRPSFRRRLNPTFVEWLMRMPFGLSGFEREATELTRWLEQMRGCLSTLHSAPTEPPQGRLL